MWKMSVSLNLTKSSFFYSYFPIKNVDFFALETIKETAGTKVSLWGIFATFIFNYTNNLALGEGLGGMWWLCCLFLWPHWHHCIVLICSTLGSRYTCLAIHIDILRQTPNFLIGIPHAKPISFLKKRQVKQGFQKPGNQCLHTPWEVDAS